MGIAESSRNGTLIHAADWIQDFGVSANHIMPGYLILVLIGLWIAGIFILTFFIAAGGFRLGRIRKSVVLLENSEIKGLFDECCDMLKIKKKPAAGTFKLYCRKQSKNI